MSRDHERDDGWVESTEGNLDPDLTEEAGYSNWEPARRPSRTMTLLRAVAFLLIVAFLLQLVASVLD